MLNIHTTNWYLIKIRRTSYESVVSDSEPTLNSNFQLPGFFAVRSGLRKKDFLPTLMPFSNLISLGTKQAETSNRRSGNKNG